MTQSDTHHALPTKRHPLRPILKGIVWVIIVVGILWGSIHVPAVQKYILQKFITSLEQKTGTDIHIASLSLSIWHGITLHELTISEQEKPLLSIGALSISLRKNLLHIINNEIDLSYLRLADIAVHSVTELHSNTSNIQNIINKLLPPTNDTPQKTPWLIQLNIIELSNVSFDIDNKNNGKKQTYTLQDGYIDIANIDLVCRDIIINEISLQRPQYTEEIYGEDCSISDDLNIEPLPETDYPQTVDSSTFTFFIGSFDLSSGSYKKYNTLLPLFQEAKKRLDLQHVTIDDINTHIDNIHYTSGSISMGLESLSAVFTEDFAIKDIQCKDIHISPNQINLPQLSIQTLHSQLQSNISLTYKNTHAFDHFLTDVYINLDVEKMRLKMADVTYILPTLKKQHILHLEDNHFLQLSGQYTGYINTLGGKNVRIKYDNLWEITGTFRTRDLLNPENTLLNIRLDNFSTSMAHVRSFLPQLKLPTNFDKLGKIQFTGRFDGYLQDFVAYGKLNSDVGDASLDMRLDLTYGTENALYSGLIELNAFNLSTWSDNPQFGLVTLKSKISEGKGLKATNASAKLQAVVKELTYKKYVYKDFNIDGSLNKNTFNGIFQIKDQNIDFVLDGDIEYIDQKTFVNVKSIINHLDLQALNLSKDPLTVNGTLDINVQGKSINQFTGDILAKNITVLKDDSTYRVDELYVLSRALATGGYNLQMSTDIGTLDIRGQYDLHKIPNSIKGLIHQNYPHLTKNWTFNHNSIDNQVFDFNIHIKQVKNYLGIIGLENAGLKQMQLKGRIDQQKQEISIATTVPSLWINTQKFSNLQLFVNSIDNKGDIQMHIDSTEVFGRKFNPIDIVTNFRKDTIYFGIATEKLIDSFEVLDIKGTVLPYGKGYTLALSDNKIDMLGTVWKINPTNKIQLEKKYISIEDFEISDGKRKISIADDEHNGISMDLNGFEFDLINPIIKYDKMTFGGLTDIHISYTNIFDSLKNVYGNMIVSNFTINGDPYNHIIIDVDKKGLDPLSIDLNIGDFIALNGKYNSDQKTLDGKAKLSQAPLYILQYILKAGISDTKGYINGDARIQGPLKNLSIKGSGQVVEGQTKVLITGVTYYFDKQNITLTESRINFDNAIIKDQNGRSGIVQGGLFHKLFRNFGADAIITGQNVVVLNTTKKDNPYYYGFGIGDVRAEFKGIFDFLEIDIEATTAIGTKLNIPVGEVNTEVKESFIKFTNSTNNPITPKKDYIPKGVNLSILLNMTPEAEVSIIFDEDKGDILRGTGRGNLKMDITRQGEFEVYGDYEVEQGEYLFTIAILPVAKPFIVQRGGLIRWTGDPVNTSMDINATYRVRTSVRPFVEEYLTFSSSETIQQATQRTEVDLKLKIGGTLFKPEISFDLNFPNIVGELGAIVDNKKRITQTNQLELNNQVVGLIVWNSFIPSNNLADAIGTSALQNAGINTLSEFLTSQFSVYITNIINNALAEKGLSAGIDFEVGLRNNMLAVGNTNNSILPDELEIRFSTPLSFLDDKVSLNIGGNYVFQNQGLTINQILPDFALELQLTDDRKLKARLYGKTDLDVVTITNLRQKYGIGIGYRTEFGAMVDFKDKIKEGLDKLTE